MTLKEASERFCISMERLTYYEENRLIMYETLVDGVPDYMVDEIYFSRYGNTEYPDDVDATTSASIVADGTGRYGTTEYVANMIQQAVGGDVHRIETVTPYTEDFDELRDVNHDEVDQNVLPELKISNLDIASYDTVFIGYPGFFTIRHWQRRSKGIFR